MTHGSLFAGIGGFDLGFERAGIKTIWQVEIDEYCRRVLKRHFPDAERFADVRECGAATLRRVDVLTGGFPCQDVSAANAGGYGLDGERSGLWFEYLRIISELRPRIAVVENVANLLNRGISTVLGGLASIGYDAEWDCIPASFFGAPHRRKRIWLVAHAAESRGRVFDTSGWLSEVRCPLLWQSFRATDKRLWLTAYCGLSGNDNGLSAEMERVRAIGNAVVPQIAEWIGRRIIEAAAKEALNL